MTLCPHLFGNKLIISTIMRREIVRRMNIKEAEGTTE
jgi:hypothetical protein